MLTTHNMQSVSSNAVAKALGEMFVGTNLLWVNPSGYSMNPNTTSNILGAYDYKLFDGFPNAPSGWHKEFVLSAQGYSITNTAIRAMLNNIGTGWISTYSASSFRMIQSSNRFKLQDIILEQTMGYIKLGTNLKFQTTDGQNTATIYSVSITCFYVKD